MTDWQPIETEPKDGKPRIYWSPSWGDWQRLVWKYNDRIARSQKRIKTQKDSGQPFVEGEASIKWWSDLSPEYYGDEDEMDDYGLAHPKNAPTHWMEIQTP